MDRRNDIAAEGAWVWEDGEIWGILRPGMLVNLMGEYPSSA